MANANQLTDCAIISGDLAIQLSGRSKLRFICAFCSDNFIELCLKISLLPVAIWRKKQGQGRR